MYKNTIELNHPLIQHKVTLLRDINTNHKDFREIINEISGLMMYEATRNLELEYIEIQTPLEKMSSPILKGKAPLIVPILRAGLGMVERMLEAMPHAKVGHIGVYRNEETFEPVYYFCKLPKDAAERNAFVVDPMLATAGSANFAIDYLKKKGVENITLMCILAAPEGVRKVEEVHPDVKIVVCKIDRELNNHRYILPGLGDAGDRIFGTK